LIPSRLVIITDLDGTLLDQESYSYEAAAPAIEKLKSVGIPLILCSSKTSSEMSPLWKELSLKDPFIVENGGAIYCPARYFSFPLPAFRSKRSFKVLELGTDVRTLRQVLAEAAAHCQTTVKSFGTMSVEEISALTGLTRDQAALARKREYDEPFLIDGGDRERLFRILIGKGLTVTHGDRFFHLLGSHGKGEAVRTLLDLYRQRDPNLVSVGLGDSTNDLPFLMQVDRPVLVRKKDGSWDAAVTAAISGIERTHTVGPQGWREAVEKILTEAGGSLL
jgi:mannosyl-3-phosphoglycerate phosphatase